MEQVKIFMQENAVTQENEVNAWLAEQGEIIEITQAFQNTTPGFSQGVSTIVNILTIFYKEKE